MEASAERKSTPQPSSVDSSRSDQVVEAGRSDQLNRTDQTVQPHKQSSPMKKSYFVVAIVILFILIILVIVWRMRKERKENPESSNIVEAVANNIQIPSDIVTESENGTIFAKWTDVKGVDSYVMYYSNKPGFTIEEARTIENISEGSFKITKVPPGTYYYRVASVKGGVKSKWSDEYSITVGKCTSYPAPKNVVVSKNPENPTEVLVSWTPDTTGDGYILYVNAETPPKGHEGNTLAIRIENPEVAEHALQGSGSGKWYAAVATMSSYCGLGELSEPVQLQ